ncbi:MAG: CGLD27 family protein [Cyanobacteriota bacterium]|nr:CGLD27 family protein [Cyanobacteriota bacterium]
MSIPNPSGEWNGVVPLEQQPLHQYQELCESFFFQWPRLSRGSYSQRLAMVWGGVAVLVAPLVAASFSPIQDFAHFGLVGVIAANSLLALGLLHLLLGWHYIHQRLTSPEILYEESGWYDAATYTKTQEEWLQHRLIGQHQVEPILRRLTTTLLLLLGITAVAVGLWMGLA